MTRMLTLAVAGALTCALAWAPAAARAECDDNASQGDSGGPNFHVEERNGQKVYVIDKVISVCGKVPRPLVAYVLQPRNINYEWENLKQDFLPKILKSVRKAPF